MNRALTEYRLCDLEQVRLPVADTPYGVGVAPDGTVAATVDDFEETGDTCVFTNGPDQPASVGNLRHNGVWNRHGAAGRQTVTLEPSDRGARFRASLPAGP